MYCPNCGRQANQGQRFCKSCGYNLATLIQPSDTPSGLGEDFRESRRRLEDVRHGVRTMFTGIGLMLFFALFFHSLGFAAIGAMVFFAGLGRIASATVFATPPRGIEFRWPRSTEERPQLQPPPLPITPPPVQSTTVPPPSVTEHTTIRLEQPEYHPAKERDQSVK